MTDPFVTRTVEPLRLLGLSTVAPSHPEIPPLVGPLFERVADLLVAAGHEPGLSVATYQAHPDGSCTIVCGFVDDGAVAGLEAFELDECEAVCLEHHGSVDTIGESWGALMTRVEAEGWRYAGPCREVYKVSPPGDMSDWVTELQQPVVR